MKVGFIGLGRMGSGMARNLLRAGHEVTVYNRTPERSRALSADGAKVAASVAEACQAEALITMLANDDAVKEVVLGPDGIVSHLRPGALHISSSTISVALARRLAEAHRARRQKFVSAPVFGRPDAAAAARLYILVAGDRAAQEAAMPLLVSTVRCSLWPYAGCSIGPTIALWGARSPEQLRAIREIEGWRIDDAAKRDIDSILQRYLLDPVPPQFMAPPEVRPRQQALAVG